MLNGGGRMKGEYLFTIDACHGDPNTVNTGVSEVPSEHKQHNFGRLENGQYFAQPNNRMLWYEQSLTPAELKDQTSKSAPKNGFVKTKHPQLLVIPTTTSIKIKNVLPKNSH